MTLFPNFIKSNQWNQKSSVHVKNIIKEHRPKKGSCIIILSET